jgi:lysozyme family protein
VASRWLRMTMDPGKQKTIVALAVITWGMLLGGFVCLVMGGQYKLTDGERLATQWAYDRMTYRDGWKEKAEKRANSIVRERSKYEIVQKVTGVPWYAVGVLDELEAGGGCSSHLHNGDPLTARTVHVPAGQPEDGDPPFTWYQSALDALEGNGWTDVERWELPDLLWRLEKWNGFGYRSYEVMSPYVWSGSQYHERGKFVADGAFDPSARSNQVGAALLLRSLAERGIIEIPRWSPNHDGGDENENTSGNANRGGGAGAPDGNRGSGRGGPGEGERNGNAAGTKDERRASQSPGA